MNDSILNGRLMSDDPLNLRKLAEYFPDDMQRPREIDIVAVEPSENFSRGFCKALVDAVILAAVFTVLEIGEFGGSTDNSVVFFDNFDTIVGAASIHHDVLKIRVV